MSTTLAFDVYGTLINTEGVTIALEKYAGEKAFEFAKLWREKQLEYSFRRGLMQNYKDFSVCTREALDYTCAFLRIEISPDEKNSLMEGYRVLPAFGDVKEGLTKLKNSEYRMFAFSNGRPDDVQNLLRNSGISAYFDGIVSVDEVRGFKPSPAVYTHFLRQSNSTGSEAWLISGNPFDVIGAISAGMRAVWVKRSPHAIFDPWEIKPTITVSSITDLYEALSISDEKRDR